MSDIVTTVDDYLAMWNEADPEHRASHIERAWAREGRYVDPLLEAQGATALGEMVAGVHAQYPGHRFRRTSGIDAHHDQLERTRTLIATADADGNFRMAEMNRQLEANLTCIIDTITGRS